MVMVSELLPIIIIYCANATEATPRLMWFNFAHLFSVSLIPLSTGRVLRGRVWQTTVSRHGKIGFGRNSRFTCVL